MGLGLIGTILLLLLAPLIRHFTQHRAAPMANRAQLVNTAILTHDGYLLQRMAGQPGHDMAQIAEAAYRIPVPWCCCFQPEDLRPLQIEYDAEAGLSDSLPRTIGIPCTTVAKALENLRQSLPVFVAMAGSEPIGRRYWQLALAVAAVLLAIGVLRGH